MNKKTNNLNRKKLLLKTTPLLNIILMIDKLFFTVFKVALVKINIRMKMIKKKLFYPMMNLNKLKLEIYLILMTEKVLVLNLSQNM